jgi:hypothetical protein
VCKTKSTGTLGSLNIKKWGLVTYGRIRLHTLPMGGGKEQRTLKREQSANDSVSLECNKKKEGQG